MRLASIIQAAAQFSGTPLGHVLGIGRTPDLVRVRHLVCAATMKFTPRTTSDLGRALNRDRTTAIHAVNRANELWDKDPQFRMDAHEVWFLANTIDAEARNLIAQRVSTLQAAPPVKKAEKPPATNVVARKSKADMYVECGSREWFERNHQRFVEGLREAALAAGISDAG